MKNQPCLSAKVFPFSLLLRDSFFGFLRGRITHCLCLRALVLIFLDAGVQSPRCGFRLTPPGGSGNVVLTMFRFLDEFVSENVFVL